MPGDQIETCTNNMIKALKWRKDENIRGNYYHNNNNLTPLSYKILTSNFRNHLQAIILIFRNNLGYIKSRFKRKRKPIPEKQRQRWMAFASFCCTEAC